MTDFKWPEPPDERVQSLEELQSLRGKAVFLVSHPVIGTQLSPARVVWGNAHVQHLYAGPLICDRGYTTADGITRARYHYYDSSFTGGQIYLTDHGDWGNKARADLSLFLLDNFSIAGKDTLFYSPLNSIFTDRELAEVWAVQIALTFPKSPASNGRFKGDKTKKQRKMIMASLNI